MSKLLPDTSYEALLALTIPAKLLVEAVAAALGERPTGFTPLRGGDINDAYLVEMSSAAQVFLKTQVGAHPGVFTAEAAGLDWLRCGGCIAVPRVLAVRDSEPWFLVLDYIQSGPRAPNFDESFGRSLAQLHQVSPPEFGLKQHNFIGSLLQVNKPADTWVEFYRRSRLEPQLQMARDKRLLSRGAVEHFAALLERLPALVGPDEPPARLHGDLWAGNVMSGPTGQAVLIDPAAYGGHREVDLAMMRLFGGFSERTFAAYSEVFPLADGALDRVPLYQLYPLLVHLNIFGAPYLGRVLSALSAASAAASS